MGDSDVLCLHDTFFRRLSSDVFASQQLVMESVLCDHLSDALLLLERLPFACKHGKPEVPFACKHGKPEVIIVHTGKNDIPTSSVDEMCNLLTEIHAFVTNHGMKLIMCNITPSYEKPNLVRKIHVFNLNVTSRLGAYNNVTICRGNSATFE